MSTGIAVVIAACIVAVPAMLLALAERKSKATHEAMLGRFLAALPKMPAGGVDDVLNSPVSAIYTAMRSGADQYGEAVAAQIVIAHDLTAMVTLSAVTEADGPIGRVGRGRTLAEAVADLGPWRRAGVAWQCSFCRAGNQEMHVSCIGCGAPRGVAGVSLAICNGCRHPVHAPDECPYVLENADCATCGCLAGFQTTPERVAERHPGQTLKVECARCYHAPHGPGECPERRAVHQGGGDAPCRCDASRSLTRRYWSSAEVSHGG